MKNFLGLDQTAEKLKGSYRKKQQQIVCVKRMNTV